MKFNFNPIEQDGIRYVPISEVRLLVAGAKDKWEMDKILEYLESFKPEKKRHFFSRVG